MDVDVKARKTKDEYFDLVKEFPLRRLRSAVEHRQALAVLDQFIGRGKLDDGVVDYLEILGDLIAKYEQQAGYGLDSSSVSAADLVRHVITENDLTISALAREIEVGQSNLSEMLSGKRDWSKKAIKGISERFCLNPMIFLA